MASFSLGSGTTSAQQVDEIPTLSPSGYAAFHNVNTIQSLSIKIFFKRLKIGPSCAFMKSVYIQLWPIKCLCSRAFCINATPLPLARISFRLLLPFKGGVHWYWKSQFFCKHNYFLSYSQLFQISQIFENVFRKLPDCVVLQPSDEKNNTAMIGKCFHIF